MDYWLFDSAELYLLHYDSGGTWLSIEIVTDPARIVAACHWCDAAFHHTMTWQEYISDKPELTRRVSNLEAGRQISTDAGLPSQQKGHRPAVDTKVAGMSSPAAVRQAVILAGGEGSRLKPYTDTRPKPMVEIAGRCIIDHQLEWLAEAGVTNVVARPRIPWSPVSVIFGSSPGSLVSRTRTTPP